MFPHDGGLLVIDRARLVENVAGNADLSNVVQQGTVLKEAQRFLLQSEALAHRPCQGGGLPGVRLGVAILRVQRRRQCLDGEPLTAGEAGRDVGTDHHGHRQQHERAHIEAVPTLQHQRKPSCEN